MRDAISRPLLHATSFGRQVDNDRLVTWHTLTLHAIRITNPFIHSLREREREGEVKFHRSFSLSFLIHLNPQDPCCSRQGCLIVSSIRLQNKNGNKINTRHDYDKIFLLGET
jgi:hypothetical protein